jgi:predicted transcriptional regulator
LDRASVGVFGTRARRLTKEWGVKVDYWFNAFDNSILGACEGKDFVLFVDDQMVPMVESRLLRLEKDFDLKISRKGA